MAGPAGVICCLCLIFTSATATGAFSQRPGNVTAVNGMSLSLYWLLQETTDVTSVSISQEKDREQILSFICHKHDKLNGSACDGILCYGDEEITVLIPSTMEDYAAGSWKLRLYSSSADTTFVEDHVYIHLVENLQVSFHTPESGTANLTENPSDTLRVAYEPALPGYVLRLPEVSWMSAWEHTITATPPAAVSCVSKTLEQRTHNGTQMVTGFSEGTSVLECRLGYVPPLYIQLKLTQLNQGNGILSLLDKCPRICPNNEWMFASVILVVVLCSVFGKWINSKVTKVCKKIREKVSPKKTPPCSEDEPLAGQPVTEPETLKEAQFDGLKILPHEPKAGTSSIKYSPVQQVVG